VAAVRFDKRGNRYAITFDYDPDIVSLIKTLPGADRGFNPGTKVWTIAETWAGTLARELDQLGYLVVGLDPTAGTPGDWASVLFDSVGRARAADVYRALSRILHPDVGGDHHLQQQLNDAYYLMKQTG